MNFISKEALERIREEYTEGARVELTKMSDPSRTDLVSGCKGTVRFVDDMGTIHVSWGQRKSFSDGKVKLPYKRFLGYRKGADGTPEIVPEEAEIILRIYSDFISGKAPSTIARELTRDGILTPSGKTEWEKKVVLSILTNEKYKGAALLQKRYTVDFLRKKTKVNEGEVPQYYVENSHPAIIEPEEWDRV